MKILETGHIGKLELRNRVIMAPMGNMIADIDGGYNAYSRAYYSNIAKGGTAMVMCTGYTCRKWEGREGTANFENPEVKPRLEQLIEDVHSYGGKVCCQMTPGAGRVGGFFPGTEAAPSASDNPNVWNPNGIHRAYTLDEIKYHIECYGRSAALVKRAGADAIEIHAYGGYLIDQFMSEQWNRRTDEYGGDLKARMKFPLDLIKAVRKNAGDIPIIFKFCPTHLYEGGRTMEEGIEIAKIVEEAGVDALHIDVGCYEVWHHAIPTVYEYKENQAAIAAAEIKKHVNIPVMAAGKFGDPQFAEKMVKDNILDFVILGRPLLADNQWVNKLADNRCEDITPCIGCVEGCMARIFAGNRIGCAVNPMTGKEIENVIKPCEPKKVLVVGAGPGGIEAAVTAAKQGHTVELWEKDEKLGGNLIAAGAPEFKKDIASYVEHLKAQVYKNNIKVRTMKPATAEDIIAAGADLVVIATGSTPIIPKVSGVDSTKVVTATDVLKKLAYPEGNIVVIGGGLVGMETALHLDQLGNKVTVVEMQSKILAEGLFPLESMALSEMISTTDIDIKVDTKLVEIAENGVVVEQDGKKTEIPCDYVIMAVGFRPENSLYEAVKGKVKDVVKIGDAVAPRKILQAVWEGYGAIRALAEK